MSNLYKGFNMKQTDERVIDYNEVISNKIASFKSKLAKEKLEADGFVSGLDADTVEVLISEGQDDIAATLVGDNDSLAEAGFEVNGPGAGVGEDDLRELAGNIISDANEKARQIVEDAMREAEEIKATAFSQGIEQGRTQGYDEGIARAGAEYQTLINQAKSERESLSQDYAKRRENMERELVDTLLEVFEKVTHTIAEDNREIVLHLINQVMTNTEATGDILIKVSKEDYPFLVENQGKIYCSSPKDINLSILEDTTVVKNQCIIETDGGVFESSLDIQLEQLIKDIKLLSCI